jgi:para-nitrobenzyl esterase
VADPHSKWQLFTDRLGKEVTDEQVTATLGRLAPGPDGTSNYRAAYPDTTPGQLYETINSDWLFRMPALHLAEAQHAGGGQARLYALCWSFNPELGASHSLDFLLVLGTLSVDDVRNHPSACPNAANDVIRVSHQMRTDWVRFATTGNPGWAPYDPDTRSTRVYDADPTTQPYPEERSRRIWCTHQFDTLDVPTRTTGTNRGPRHECSSTSNPRRPSSDGG